MFLSEVYRKINYLTVTFIYFILHWLEESVLEIKFTTSLLVFIND